MIIRTSVELGPDETLLYDPDAAAAQLIAALGGNAAKDVAYVTTTQSESGQAGTPPAPPGGGMPLTPLVEEAP